jgi:hypothetical protein
LAGDREVDVHLPGMTSRKVRRGPSCERLEIACQGKGPGLKRTRALPTSR